MLGYETVPITVKIHKSHKKALRRLAKLNQQGFSEHIRLVLARHIVNAVKK